MKKWSITGAPVLTPDKLLNDTSIDIYNGKLQSVAKGSPSSHIVLELEDGIVAPGLINAHDHLLGTYFPKVGNGPYTNWLPWDNDLKSAPVYQERQQIENRDLYLLGSYRNLISGVTTVSDHIPHFVGDPFYDILPVKAIKDFAMAHSVTSFALAWGDGIAQEYQKAADRGIPFVTHIAEGFDDETVKDLTTIERAGGLGEYSVFVHGIAFTPGDMKKIKAAGASVVWCGDSNMFMFNETTNIKMLLDMGINVCIGTDSPMSGGLNILAEMKYDRKLFHEMYGEFLPDRKIVEMVTTNGSKAFHDPHIGSIKQGNCADLTVFRNNKASEHDAIVSAGLADIMLVVIDGKPVYGDSRYRDIFDALDVEYSHVIIEGRERVIIGDPVGLMQRVSRAVGFKKELPFLPVEFEFKR